jgi:hypothetical protein
LKLKMLHVKHRNIVNIEVVVSMLDRHLE